MKLIKKILLGAALTISAAASQAALVNVAGTGVFIDPNAPLNLDFSSSTNSLRQNIDPVTGKLSGFGLIQVINGDGMGTFCPGCQLTFTFDNYLPSSPGAVPIPGGGSIPYVGGTVQVYVTHNAADFVSTTNAALYTASQFNKGVLFLGLQGHIDPTDAPNTFHGTISPITGQISKLEGGGLLDVMAGAAGGAARATFDTNTQTDNSDVLFSATFTKVLATNSLGVPIDAIGGGTFAGDTVPTTVPEPASLALAGLGLLCAGIARRRKAA